MPSMLNLSILQLLTIAVFFSTTFFLVSTYSTCFFSEIWQCPVYNSFVLFLFKICKIKKKLKSFKCTIRICKNNCEVNETIRRRINSWWHAPRCTVMCDDQLWFAMAAVTLMARMALILGTLESRGPYVEIERLYCNPYGLRLMLQRSQLCRVGFIILYYIIVTTFFRDGEELVTYWI